MRLRPLLSLPFAAWSCSALAQPLQGLYLGAGAGVNLASDDWAAPSAGGRPGPAVVGSLGHAVGHGLRLELEGAYRRNDARDRDLADGQSGLSSRASRQRHGAMANAFLDLDAGLPWVRPYLGGGLGVQWVRDRGTVEGIGLLRSDPLSDRSDTRLADRVASGAYQTFRQRAEGTGARFAYQAVAGAAFPVAAAPGLSLTLEYRFLGVPGARRVAVEETDTAVRGGRAASSAWRGEGWAGPGSDHSVLLGLRYEFLSGAARGG
ncbi:hypothetical protein EAH89_24180 [Roseomonas nepalensis]|uniref:Outer membrane protein beta-barrel domain-containing protein n=1 Tax=Muricoccus nepalensis TaxID=1854500 RepID=A0A502FCL7_9PROT|nr:outer membrane beta-barrel protein [Roseomonas nepalensis]TPG47084.1 hypothetical protein EAH89_24180 [Roseomonas nepalensis]